MLILDQVISIEKLRPICHASNHLATKAYQLKIVVILGPTLIFPGSKAYGINYLSVMFKQWTRYILLRWAAIVLLYVCVVHWGAFGFV